MTHCWSPSCGAEAEASAVACTVCGVPLTIRDKYRIVGMLGQGGMGVVYAAVDEHLGREVAVKVMHGRHAERSALRDRFQTEARAMAALDHPGIARIFDADVDHDRLFFAQQLVAGRPLRDWVRRTSDLPALPLGDAVRLAQDLCAALEHAHDKGIVHRDINPNNVIVVERRGAPSGLAPVIIDFGLARTADQDQTRVACGGTAGYAAPEQLLDPTSNDPRSDLFAVAAVLHALLSRGGVPYSQVLVKGIHIDPRALTAAYGRIGAGEITYVPPERAEGDLPPGVVSVLARALAPRPFDRFASADAFATALAPYASGAAIAASDVGAAATVPLPRLPSAAAEVAPESSTVTAQVIAAVPTLAAPVAASPAPVTPSLAPSRAPRVAAVVAGVAAFAVAARLAFAPAPPPASPAAVAPSAPIASASTSPPAFAARPAGPTTLALFAPSGVAVAPDGSVVVADRGNHRLLVLEGGALRVLAGTGAAGFADGPADAARFDTPRTVKIGPDGAIYVADEGNHRVRVLRGGRVETLAGTGEAGFADGPVATAKLDHPSGIALRPDGGVLVTDRGNHRVRLVLAGQVTTVAGVGERGFADGSAGFAKLDSPSSVAFAPDGAIYVADAGNLRLRVLRGGMLSTALLMADRPTTVDEPSLSAFDWQPGLTVAPDGAVYFAAPDRHRVMVVRDGKAQVFAGSGDAGSADGDAANATFSLPQGVAVGPDGAVYIADAGADRVRVVRDRRVSTIVSSAIGGYVDGPVADARFSRPWGLGLGPDGALYVADWMNHRVRVLQGGEVRTLAGSGVAGFRDGPVRDADFHSLWDLDVDARGAVYVADGDSDRVRAIEGGVVRTIAGGVAGQELRAPAGVAVAKDGTVYVADTQHHRVCILAGGELKTLAGTGAPGFKNGAATEAQFNRPAAVEVDDQGWLYVADAGNDRIRLVRHGSVTTFAGSGDRGFSDGEATAARFDAPVALVMGREGALVVADLGNHRVRVVDRGAVRTLAGSGIDGYADGPAAEARFARPSGVEVGPDGAVYVTDSGNHLVRVIRGGRVETIAGR